MPLPSYTKTWQLTRNSTVAGQASVTATHQKLVKSIIDALLALSILPPTVRYSCNGTTAGTAGDGVNRWSTDSSLVWAGSGAHSWMVLRFSGITSTFEVCFDLLNSNTYVMTIVMSQSAAFTGGTTSARPTATDEVVLLSAGNYGAATTAIQHRFSVLQSTDGQCCRVLLCFSGGPTGLWLFEKPANATNGWTNPNFGLIYGNTGSITASISNLNTLGRSRIGSTTATMQLLCEGTSSGAAIADSTWGNAANDIDGSWPLFPVGIASTTVGTKGRHGTLQDIYWGSQAIATAEGYPADGTNRWIQVGGLVLPWGEDSTGLSLT